MGDIIKGIVLVTTLLALVACNKVDQNPETTAPNEAACLTNTDYFAHKIWWPILAADCVGCHNSQGAAKESKFVLQSSWQTGFLDHNLKVFEQVAAFEVYGSSIILQKPIGELDHGGSKRFTADSEEFVALQEMVKRFKSPVSCSEASEDSLADSLELLSLEATLRKASLNLAARLPSDDEYKKVSLKGTTGLNEVLDQMLTEEAFYARLKEIYNDHFLTDRYLGGEEAVDLLSDDDYPNREWFEEAGDSDLVSDLRNYANTGVAREPLELVAHVVRNDRPFTEILSADYVMVNPYSARSYGVSMNAFPDGADPEDYDPNQYFEARLAGVPHAGILTSHMFLNRFPTTETNVNRHRSRMVYQFFLATDVMRLADRAIDPTSIEEFNPTMYTPSCAICHAVIDPLAGAFQNWDEGGNYRQPENGWNQDMRPPGFAGKVMPHEQRFKSLKWLAARIAEDKRFSTATIHILYNALTGRQALRPPSYVQTDQDRIALRAFEAQDSVFKEIAEAFIESDHNLKSVIKALIQSKYYRAVSAKASSAEMSALDSFGSSRLLTPEMLHRKIIAITNLRLRRNNRDILLDPNEFLIFYGGIDSDQVVNRISSPNGIMANIAQRIGNVVACNGVSRDFFLPAEKRRLFPMTERSFVPIDDNGFVIPEAVSRIKANLRYLHQRILGEFLTADDPEIERSYQLFLETWREGQAGMREGLYSIDLPSVCRTTRDPVTNENLSNENRISRDENYVMRSWMAVITYMLSDISFLYE